MSQLSVFKNRRILLQDHTPSRLPHREEELRELKRCFEPVIHEDVSVKVHIYGRIGTGKTVLCSRLGCDLEKEAARFGKKLKFVHVNLAYAPKPYHLMTKLLDEISFAKSPHSGLSPEEMLAIVAKTLIEQDLSLVLALDEVDSYLNEKRDPRIFYLLPRIHELYPDSGLSISLIYVSRSLDWMQKLDKATLDTLGRTSGVHLEDYSPPQVRDIVAYRAEEAFKYGAISEEVIDFVARIAVSYGGIRYALELLHEAGGQAELDYAKVVTADHVRRAHALIPKGVNGAYYPGELSLHKQLLLKGVIEALGSSCFPYVALDEVYLAYQAVCNEYGREAEEESVIHSYLGDLAVYGYLILREENQRKLVAMEYPLDRLEKALEENLKEALRASDDS